MVLAVHYESRDPVSAQGADREASLSGDMASRSSSTELPGKKPPNKSKISIRLVERTDKENIRVMLKRFHDQTIWGGHAFSDKKFNEHARAIFAKPAHMVCLVAEKDGAIVGLAWASAGSYSLSEELILATCHVIAVDRDALSPIQRAKTFLRLLKGIKKWSDTRGASEVLVHVTTGTDLKATDRLLRKAGARMIGGGYVV
jgi:hypothetical protein